MLKTIIVFPDGRELSSGVNSENAIQSFSMIECVNAGDELTIGSVCCNSIEVKVFTPSGEFNVESGTEVTVYRQDQTDRHKIGVFVLDKPTRVTANTMKLVGYDRISKLDKDLTAWLAGVDEWPAEPEEFAQWICYQCGVRFAPTGNHPNSNYRIEQFSQSTVTGRQLMKWLAEICCCFCRANADGDIEFAWYKDSGVEIAATGENYYFQNGFSYDDFVLETIKATQIRLSSSENGVPWPLVEDGTNSYIIAGNPMMPKSISDHHLGEILHEIETRLEKVSYTPCKVSIPARMDIHAGDIVYITDKNGKRITCYVMTKTQSGLKDTLECVGSKRRDSTQAMNNKTQQDVAEDVMRAQTREDIFNKLTDGGKIQGIYQENGEWYINCELAHIYNIVASAITSGIIKSVDGRMFFDLDNAAIHSEGEYGEIEIRGDHIIMYKDLNQCISIWPDGEHAGRIQFGSNGAFVYGDNDNIVIYTRASGTAQKEMHTAKWKTITYKDESGATQTVRVLAGE